MITESINRAYENLANAIIIQAVKDIRNRNCYSRRAKTFLKSEWCRDLSKVDGRMILKKVQEEMAAEAKQKKNMEVI